MNLPNKGLSPKNWQKHFGLPAYAIHKLNDDKTDFEKYAIGCNFDIKKYAANKDLNSLTNPILKVNRTELGKPKYERIDNFNIKFEP